MKHPAPPLSRAHRVARGGMGAAIATLLAAASHGLAGGSITLPAIIVTGVIALPLCTALAGRIGSVWRLSLGVAFAQFLYHWSFAGISAAGSGSAPLASGGIPVSPHAAHLLALESFAAGLTPGLAPALSADTTMWAMHGIAAIITIAILHRGERAFLSLRGMLRKAYTPVCITLGGISVRPQIAAARPRFSNVFERLFSAVTHRGPPAAA
ncbi:hypothetical protein G7067_11515 [Leucobacter insecticola]|uniref:Uncharacterized protein n=1 Tax=Leucobacter insecticola TaxID=2714934 RepID=A0A6G8FKC3_9MICO|nr:hypothetical protein [Leucobacter insecticola]QIM16886.1 hypothetical protein G7067_11515 [Leucobacter insecticola]